VVAEVVFASLHPTTWRTALCDIIVVQWLEVYIPSSPGIAAVFTALPFPSRLSCALPLLFFEGYLGLAIRRLYWNELPISNATYALSFALQLPPFLSVAHLHRGCPKSLDNISSASCRSSYSLPYS